MAVNRMDTGKGDEEKTAATAAPSAPAQGGGGGIAAWLPLVLAVVLMPVVAYVITSSILVPQLRKGISGGTQAAAPAQGHGEHGGEEGGGEAAASGGHGGEAAAPSGRQTVTMNKMLVNVAGTMGSRYLLTSVTLVGSSADFKMRVERNDAQLRDMAGGILSTKTIPDLEKPGARNLIRSELLNGFNSILGASAVQEIYITEFAIQ
jgi:flagellar FliL protein